MDFFPLWLSLKVSVTATILTVATGLPLAWVLALKRFPGRDLAEALVVLPLVLPPTVLGYYLLVLISRQGAIGASSTRRGSSSPSRGGRRSLAAWVGSSALFIKAAQAGFESVDRRLEQAALTLGRSQWSVFWSVTLPLASRAVMAGTVLAFCRALGDFGITLMVAGSIPGVTQTTPLAIYDLVQSQPRWPRPTRSSLIAVGDASRSCLVGIGRLARLRF